MTLTQLKYTLAVAEEGNFTQAAERCFVTQPTLSMQVQKLEEELNIELFNRKSKPITLTAVGEKIIDQAKVILEEAARMNDVVATARGVVEGHFRIGIIPTVMPTLLVSTFATIFSPPCITNPVRSKTPFGIIIVFHSIHSPAAGVPAVAIANFIVIAVVFLFVIETFATVYEPTGTVYTVVSVFAARSCTPNLPVAIFSSPSLSA